MIHEDRSTDDDVTLLPLPHVFNEAKPSTHETTYPSRPGAAAAAPPAPPADMVAAASMVPPLKGSSYGDASSSP